MAARSQPEARSLSAINYLAANPPQYPYHPELRESLTLYISRVPGTQDVILSTFRPQKKTVTGEDITNSLYYIHLDSPEDALLTVPQHLGNAASPRSSSESARSTIPRKPLPPSSRASIPEASATTSAVQSALPVAAAPAPPEPLKHNVPPVPTAPEPLAQEGVIEGYRENPMFRKRRSVAPSESPASPPRRAAITPSPSTSSIPRKSISARPPSTLLTPDTPVESSPQERPVTPTKLSPQAGHAASSPNPITPPASHAQRDRTPSPKKTGGQRAMSSSFSLTIIRRDPTSGTQCNVGKVTSFQTNVPTPDYAGPHLDPDNMGGPHTQKIDIRIETSGYAKYRDMPNRASVDAYRPTSGHSFSQQMLRGAAAPTGGEKATALKPAWGTPPGPADDCFSRQVVMSYGASWKSNFKKAFQPRDGPSSPGTTSPDELAPPRPFHARKGSTSTIASVESVDGGYSSTLITEPRPGLKPKGYVFWSPWDGRCEFRTSADGRGLKCRHVLDPENARLDPRVVAQHVRDAQAMGRSRSDELSSALAGAKPVSELRFNLPNGTFLGGGGRDVRPQSGRFDPSAISAQFSKLLHHRSRSSDESSYDDDEYNEHYDEHHEHNNSTPMDLSLGKERAGGGAKGKSAKLGKLIIHDEGLKMLDLVVAANIGVWWTTWGRTL